MRYWLGNDGLDRHVCLAVHNLKQADSASVAVVARGMLVTNRHVDPRIQFLPEDVHIEESLQRLIRSGFVKQESQTFAPAKEIYQGWL